MYVMIIIIFVLLFRQSHHVFRLLLIGCTSRIILTCRVRIFPYIDKCTVKLLVHSYHYFSMYIRISGSQPVSGDPSVVQSSFHRNHLITSDNVYIYTKIHDSSKITALK